MAIMDFIKRLTGGKPIGNLEKKLNVQIATSGIMDNAISLWLDMYRDEPPWAGGADCVKSMNVPAAISEELSRLVLTEFTFGLDGSQRATYIQEQLGHFLEEQSNIIELWNALGGVALKPYPIGDDGNGNPTGLSVDVNQASRFYPTAFDSNKNVTGAVFVDTKRVGDFLFTKLEYHNLEGTTYTVVNKAFRSERLITTGIEDEQITCRQPLSEEVSLDSVPGWEGIEPETVLENIEHPLFVYIKQPKANNLDPGSPLGVSVYSRAVDVIEEVDKQFSRILWEYKATEAAVLADQTVFGTDRLGRPVIKDGDERLYRLFDFEGTDVSGFMKEYAPEIRDTAMFNGMNQYLRKIEMLCGLAYGTFSDVSDIEKTATEIRTSKQRSYTTVNAMQRAWQGGLERLVYIMDVYCSLYNLAPPGKVDVYCTWGDGVLEDTEVEYQRRWSMVLAGKLKIEKFYAWYFGISEEEAAELVPEATIYPPEE